MTVKYKEVAEALEKEILQGVYEHKLPREEDLIERFGVSRSTVRKAIGRLVAQGYIYQVQGSGIFLRSMPHEEYISLEQLKGLSRDFPHSQIESRVIKLELVEAGEDLAKVAECRPDDLFYHVIRLRVKDGIPFSLEDSWYPKNVVRYISQEIAESSIYSYIMDDLGLPIGFADKIISARKLTADEADLFGEEAGDPTLVVTGKMYLKSGIPFEFSESIHNYKYARFLKNVNF